MRSSSAKPTVESAIERVRPLLGTTVSIRVVRCEATQAHHAIDAAFDAIAHVHSRMSFHDADSDLSRLHRTSAGQRVVVAAATATVLREALRFAVASDGAFDISVAAQLVAQGLLPRPIGAIEAVAGASWRDIEVDANDGVTLHRPLWIDLGGIAKGYAVDRAIDALCACGVAVASVNAGGDLRMLGVGPHQILIAVDNGALGQQPLLEIDEAAVATSGGRAFSNDATSVHLHGRTGERVGMRECVSVVAPRCLVADSLTKIVLALGPASSTLLRNFEATAYLRNAEGQWTALGVPA